MSETYAQPATSPPFAPARSSPFALAGRCLRWATATLTVAAVSIGLFFGGAGYVFGPINDVTTAATLLLMAPGVLAVRRLAAGRVGSWFSALSFLTVAGLAVAAGGLIALVVGLITLNTSFVTGGIGILPFVAWLAAVAHIALRRGVLTRRVGWLSLAALGISIIAGAAGPLLPMTVLVFAVGLPLLAVLAAWLWVTGTDLLDASSTQP